MNLEKFNEVAARKQKKLSTFLTQLETLVPPQLSGIVKAADEATWKQTDCTTCANCCKTMTPTFSEEDVTRIAAHLNMTPAAFRKKWLYKEKRTGDWMNRSQPCQFLENDKCSIYEVRPLDCAEFPHHKLRPWDLYGDTYMANMMHCPATLRLVDKVRRYVVAHYEWPEETETNDPKTL